MAEGAALEMLYTGNCIEGSNPSSSASRLRRSGLEFGTDGTVAACTAALAAVQGEESPNTVEQRAG